MNDAKSSEVFDFLTGNNQFLDIEGPVICLLVTGSVFPCFLAGSVSFEGSFAKVESFEGLCI